MERGPRAPPVRHRRACARQVAVRGPRRAAGGRGPPPGSRRASSTRRSRPPTSRAGCCAGRSAQGEDVTRLDNPLGDFRRYTRQLPGHSRQRLQRDPLRGRRACRAACRCASPRSTSTTARAGTPTTGRSWTAADSLFLRIGSEVDAPLPRPDRSTVAVTLRAGYVAAAGCRSRASSPARLHLRRRPRAARGREVQPRHAERDGARRADPPRRLRVHRRAAARRPCKVGMTPYRRGRSQPEGALPRRRPRRRGAGRRCRRWSASSASPTTCAPTAATATAPQPWERRFEAGHDAERLGAGFFEAEPDGGRPRAVHGVPRAGRQPARRAGPRRGRRGARATDGVVHGQRRDVVGGGPRRGRLVADPARPTSTSARGAPRRSEPPKQDPGTFVVAEAEEEKAPASAKPPTAQPERETRSDEVTEEPPSPAPRVVARGAARRSCVVGGCPRLKWWRGAGDDVRPERRARPGGGRVAGAARPRRGPRHRRARASRDPRRRGPRPGVGRPPGSRTTCSRPATRTTTWCGRMWELVDAERRALVAEHGWRGRLRAWWNPASLEVLRIVADVSSSRTLRPSSSRVSGRVPVPAPAQGDHGRSRGARPRPRTRRSRLR